MHVRVNDPVCSGEHVKLFLQEDNLYIEDLGSKNGIILNGIKVFKQRIFIGDLILIGNTRIEVDHHHNSHEVIEMLTPTHRRTGGNITLELETFKEISMRRKASQKQKDYVRDAKLFTGVADTVQRQNAPEAAEGLKLKVAYLVDMALAFGVLAAVHATFRTLSPETDPLIYLLSGIVAGFIFFKWNRARAVGSLGEKILGID